MGNGGGVMLAERLADISGYVIAVAGVALVVLAYWRVRIARELEEATNRDDGKYWRSLPWEERSRYIKRLSVMNWSFSLVILVAIIYGAWSHWYHWYHGGEPPLPF